MSNRLLITDTRLRRIDPPEKQDLFLRDVALAGFGVRVKATGTMSFIVEARLKDPVTGKSKSRRRVLGKWSEEYGSTEARADARLELARWGKGESAPSSSANEVEQIPTLEEVFSEYIETRQLKPRTVDEYEMLRDTHLASWKELPISLITRDMVQHRHREIGKSSKSRANATMRVLRALFNFSMAVYEDRDGKSIVTENPVLRLKATGAWYRVPRRRTVIKTDQLADWYASVLALEGERGGSNAEVVRDYLLFLLFTGKRSEEAATLEFDCVDLTAKTFVAEETKNWEEHQLPMSEPVFQILDRRLAEVGPFVFPSGKQVEQPIRNVRWWCRKVTEESGVEFTFNDLRRTFISIAESLDLSGYTLKRLLNHKIAEHDVTAGYIISDVERLRDPMERIADKILGIISK